MKNTKLLLVSLLFLMISGIVAKDINLRTYNAAEPINTLDSSGNNLMHKTAQNCQNFDSGYSAISAQKVYQEYGSEGVSKANPFILNEDQKTPKKIASGMFKATGSVNCKKLYYVFATLEQELAEKLYDGTDTKND